MSVKNKVFVDNRTGDKIKIIDSFNDIAITESKSRVSVSRLLDPNYYTEEINPDNFLNNEATFNLFADKIKNIDTSKLPEQDIPDVTSNIPTDPNFAPATNESAVMYSDPEDEKAELLRKYGHAAEAQSDVQRQQDAFDKLLNEEQAPQNIVQPNPQTTARVVDPGNTIQPDPQPAPQFNQPDPMEAMFKNIKRNKKFSVSIDIDEKIPRTDFIEMMEDSYEKSIIDYLATEFTNKILQNPGLIKDKITKELELLVYPDGRPIDEDEEVIDIPESDTLLETATIKPTQQHAEKLAEIADEKAQQLDDLLVDILVEDEEVGEVIEEVEETSEEILNEVEELIEEVKEKEKPEPPKPPKDRIIKEGEEPPKPKSMEDDK